ncbi:UNVERIFIED_CONTAM: Transcription elongation regulator 1 [Trichonephila clavipes]
MFNEDFDYFPEHQRNMHFEKLPHGPGRGHPGHMRCPPGMRRRMMPDGGGPPPNFRGPRGEPMYDNEFPQPHGMPHMGMGGPQNMPRGPPGHFGGGSPQHMGGNPQFDSPRQPQPGMPNKGHLQRPPMVPPFGVPPPGFPPGGGPPHSQNRNPQISNRTSPNIGSSSNVSNLDLSGELWVETKTSEAALTSKSTFSDFAQRYGKDERFKAIDKMREREAIFNDYLSDLRRKERDERYSQKEKAKKGFIEMLKEHRGLDKLTRWTDVKKAFADDPRYKAVESSSLRDEWFKEYVGAVARNQVRESEDDVSKEWEKQERVEASIREREKEVQRTLSTHLRERDKERELHKHDEAVQHFKALLTDLVRSPDVSFHEVKKILRKDHRWDMVGELSREERERMFEEHINQLCRKKKEKFRELLDETPEVDLDSTWKEIRRLIKNDPRCFKLSSSDRKCEKEFKEYLKDKLVTAKADFRELLKETKMITYKSRKLIEDSSHLNDIVKVLKNDRRFLVLNCMENERTDLLMAYLEALQRKGPPPSPIASELIRRSTK